MTVRTKVTLTIIGTLIIGILIGATGSRIAFTLIGPPPDFDPSEMPGRFTRVMIRAIEPTAEQEDTVRAIIQTHAEIAAASIRNHFAQQQTLVDSMKADLNEVVSEDQMARLERRMEWIKKHFAKPGQGERRGRRGQGGPPPHGGGRGQKPPPDGPPPGEPPPDDSI